MPHSSADFRRFSARHGVHAGVALGLVIVSCVAGVLQNVLADLPELDPAMLRYRQSVEIQDRTGESLYRMYGDEDRIMLDTSAISPYLRSAIVAIEDERFFERRLCVDLVGIARAFGENMRTGQQVQGGSTITQQLVRAVYLSPEKTIRRKIREAALACRMERMYTKDEILTLYINRVPFGGTLYGAERAAQAYFGVSAAELTLAQSAALAAIPQRPSVYTDPVRMRTVIDHDLMNALRQGTAEAASIEDGDIRGSLLGRSVSTPDGPRWVGGRAETVLAAMHDQGMISKEQMALATLSIRRMTLEKTVQPRAAPHFVEAIRQDVEGLLTELGDGDAWVRSGMRVRTTLDPELQRVAEQTVLDARELLWKSGARHAALVAIDRDTREVLAYVGNVDYDDPDAGAVDMASSPRQTGSAIKPVVYAADLNANGTNSGTFILDGPLPQIGNPKNYDGGFRGWMRVKNALGQSRNLPAIRSFFRAGGEESVLQVAAAMGVSTPLRVAKREREIDPWFSFGWPMAIGSAEVPLLELVQAYATIAEGGVYRPLRTVDRIDDRAGDVLLQIPEEPGFRAIDPYAAGEIDEILHDPLTRPKGFWRNMLTIPGIATGAKTGTSNVCLRRSAMGRCLKYGVNNVWTVGYDDRMVVGVWVGNADNAPLEPTADGLTVAAPIWRAFLEQAHGRAVATL